MGFPGGSVVNNLSAKQEMLVQSLGWENTLEKEMASLVSLPGKPTDREAWCAAVQEVTKSWR